MADTLALLAVVACFVAFGLGPVFVWVPTPGWSERERCRRLFGK